MEELRNKFPGAVEAIDTQFGETTVTLKKESLSQVCEFLKQEKGYDYLSDLTGLDLGKEAKPRFAVVYHLYSMKSHQRLRLKVKTDDAVDTVSSIWKAADWFEREVFDLLGVRFNHHPNLTRIYMPDDFNGYPLRKDYPLAGER
jgi:NADH-quinone oxidoreductase subunit C